MSYFVIEVIWVFLLVTVFATWIKLVPRYPKWKYTLIQQLTNIAFQTLFTLLLLFIGVYPSWLLLFPMVLFLLWLSVRFTDNIVRRKGESTVETPNGNSDNKETQRH